MTKSHDRRPRVLVVGDAMLDRERLGAMERISPEAPVPIVRLTAESARLGGAAVVAELLAGLGCETIFAGCVGGDESGEEIAERLHAAGVSLRLLCDPQRCTTVKTRIVAETRGRRQPVLRLDDETTAPLGDLLQSHLLIEIDNEIPSVDVVLISDYGKGVVSPTLVASLVRSSRRAGIPVFVDPAKNKRIVEFSGATLVKLNRLEAAAAMGGQIHTLDQAVAAAKTLRERLGGAAVVVTLDRDGAVLVDGRDEYVVPTAASRVEDVSGAGDAVLAVLGFAAALGYPLRDALRFAMHAAAMKIEATSDRRLTRDDVFGAVNGSGDRSLQSQVALPCDRAPPSHSVPSSHTAPLSRGATANSSHKLMLDHNELAARLNELRRAGNRIAFTNGCFDLLHVGHLTTLQTARAAGDVLVAAVNSDESVKRLKGSGRPILPEAERTVLLAALACVDFVTVFDADDPAELIALLRPHVLVKGGDYRPEEIVGAESIARHGGRVIVAPLVADRSTTQLANDLASSGTY